VIASAAAAAAAVLVGRRVGPEAPGPLVGAVAGLALLVSPDVLRQVDTVMLDTFQAVLILLATLSWAAYAGTGRTRWSVLFGMSAGAAILTNGSAYGLALLPILYIALTGRFTLLANWRTWLSAIIVLVATVPWFAMTYRITSDGLVYSWGLAYTELATVGFTQAAWHVFGVIGVTAFLLGTIVAAWRAWRGQRDETVLACAATAIALFVLHLVAPADIQSRYLIAIAPEVVVVAAAGLAGLATGTGRPLAPASVVVSGLLLNAALTFQWPPASPRTMNQVAREIIASPGSAPLVLVASSSYGEGALVAAFAAFDPAHDHYVVRASKALAKSNFLGSDYQARFHTADEVQQWIEANHISWLVLDERPGSMEMLHDRQLTTLAGSNKPQWRLVSEQQRPSGLVRVFRLTGAPPSPAEIAAVLSQVAPEKVIGGASG
jgi:4-amino-4-deoxy-L-arabinose transferase-like glycosyltransferase